MEKGEGTADSQDVPLSNPPLENGTPTYLMTGVDAVKLIVETYGWFLLIAVLISMYLYHRYKPSYNKWKQKQEELRESEEMKKNPDKAYAIQLAMEESRLRLQERVSVDCKVKRAKEDEIADQKRHQKIEEWQKHKEGRGYHSKSSNKLQNESTDGGNQQLKPKKKSELRPSFNPLSGGGGSSGYRPSRRSNGGGGG